VWMWTAPSNRTITATDFRSSGSTRGTDTAVLSPLILQPMKLTQLLLLAACLVFLNGCFLTKIVTVPMRVGGAVISILPVVGNPAHDAVDEAADALDDIPL